MNRYWTLGLSALLCVLLVGSVMALEVNGVTRGKVPSGFRTIETPRYISSHSLPNGVMLWSEDGSDFWYNDWSDSTTLGITHRIPGYQLMPVFGKFLDSSGRWFAKISVNCATDSVDYAWTMR